jgi:hypothetical protein
LLVSGAARADSRNQVFSDFTTPLPLPPGDTLVLGIVGGWERWDAEQRIIRRLCLMLREEKLPGVHVETVENHKLYLAQELIEKAFPEGGHRIVIYGQSLGGAAAVRLARWLNERNIPVLFTLQMDSIGVKHSVIPPNVRAAANLYQRDLGFIRGLGRIRAEDPERTKIIGNFRFRYPLGKEINLYTEPWVRKTFMTSHLKFEYDPEVWAMALDLLKQHLPNATAGSAAVR